MSLRKRIRVLEAKLTALKRGHICLDDKYINLSARHKVLETRVEMLEEESVEKFGCGCGVMSQELRSNCIEIESKFYAKEKKDKGRSDDEIVKDYTHYLQRMLVKQKANDKINSIKTRRFDILFDHDFYIDKDVDENYRTPLGDHYPAY